MGGNCLLFTGWWSISYRGCLETLFKPVYCPVALDRQRQLTLHTLFLQTPSMGTLTKGLGIGSSFFFFFFFLTEVKSLLYLVCIWEVGGSRLLSVIAGKWTLTPEWLIMTQQYISFKTRKAFWVSRASKEPMLMWAFVRVSCIYPGYIQLHPTSIPYLGWYNPKLYISLYLFKGEGIIIQYTHAKCNEQERVCAAPHKKKSCVFSHTCGS